MKNLEKAQHLLPVAYLYLIILGLIKETLTFYPLGINILKYATIMDVLISPIADIFSHYLIFITIFIISVIAFSLPQLMVKNFSAKWVNAYLGRKKNQPRLTLEEVKDKSIWFPVRFLAFMFLSFFVGFGWANGMKEKRNIKSGNLKYKHTLYFTDNQSQQVHLIDVNNAYYFYVEKDSKKIKISPVDAIKALEIDPLKHRKATQ